MLLQHKTQHKPNLKKINRFLSKFIINVILNITRNPGDDTDKIKCNWNGMYRKRSCQDDK